MRVLLTTDTVGGVWTYTRELTEGLLQSSASVALVSFGRPPTPEQTAWCSETASCHGSSFRYIASSAPLEWMTDNEDAYRRGKALLIEVARNFKADLLHSNQFCFGKVPVDVPKLVVAHSDVLSWSAACRPEGLDRCEWLTRYTSMVQDGLTAADAVIAPTRWMLRALAEGFRLPEKSGVIENGRTIAGPIFNQKRTMQAVSAGRLWDEAKNLSLLCDVRTPMPIVAAGEGPCREPSTHGGHEKFRFLGSLGEEDLLALFRSSAIYLCASIYEPFGLAALEAALCGCAVLANDLHSLREVWGEAATYFHDAKSLSARLYDLAGNPETLKRCQRRCRQRALRWTRERMTARYLKLYREMFKEKAMANMTAHAAETERCVA